MAVKERKQITGTTAQINTYKGHEGQIVWDKEKKTFVGMSGTAGKNYPLATKEYVDNEVVKVNTELQETNAEVATKQPKGDYATNAQLTEDLAGKEDKGVCLPLTGGTVLGDILNDPASRDEMFLGHSFTSRKGAFISLRADNHEIQQGAFVLGARLPTKEAYLQGNPTGELLWNGGYVVTSPSTPVGVIRLSNGLQICWGSATTSGNGGAYVSFKAPFSEAFYVVNASIAGGADSGSGRSNWVCIVDRVDTAGTNLWAFNNGVPTNNIVIYYTAIGRWTVN